MEPAPGAEHGMMEEPSGLMAGADRPGPPSFRLLGCDTANTILIVEAALGPENVAGLFRKPVRVSEDGQNCPHRWGLT